MFLNTLKEKEFLKRLFLIATPIILQYLITTSLNFLDVFMIGQLGDTEVAAVGAANQVFFIFIMFIFSIAGGTSIFTAQYWGKKDINNIRSFMSIGIIISFTIAVIFTILVLLFPKFSISIFTDDHNVQNLGKDYIIIIAFSFIITAATINYAVVTRSTEHIILPTISSISGFSTNTILNYIMIFGKFGFPALGVKGAAIATVIARCVEFTILISLTYIKKHPAGLYLNKLFNFNKEMFLKFIYKTLHVTGQSMGWVLGYSMYSIIYGHIDKESYAAYNIACSIERICLMFFTGLGSACAIMVGNRIGANEEKKAKDYSKNFLLISFIMSIIISSILFIFKENIANIYNLSDKGILYIKNILFVMSCIMWARAANIVFIMGILRGGGDTFFSMAIDLGGIWLIGVPIAAICAFIFHFPVYLVMAYAALEEFVKMTLCYIRFFSSKWLNNLVKPDESLLIKEEEK